MSPFSKRATGPYTIFVDTRVVDSVPNTYQSSTDCIPVEYVVDRDDGPPVLPE